MRTRAARLLRGFTIAAFFGALSMSCGGGDEGGELTAPADLKANLLAGPAVHLTWKDTSSAEHHFSIERKTGAGAFAEIATELLNTTAHHDATVESGMTYTYRVAAAMDDGEKSPYSAEATVTVP